MKNSLKALVVVAILAIAGMASAQNSANADATANATVVCPIKITNTHSLDFGTITNSATGGTVVVTPAGTATYTNVVATTGSHASPVHEADFTIGGESGFTYTVTNTIVTNFTPPGGAALISALTWQNGSGQQIKVFPCDADNDGGIINGAPDSYDLSDDGPGCGCVSDVIKVGGTLTITSAAEGVYTGKINCAIAYN
jgi:hypothetical protein